ncbi:MAG: tRNA pseudouridine(55) synthase TruB [Treponema sp.]|jgi:tRNA pseudouridine55 synthase|nr:tRNA pseudouridine(55) synthase TruB [Treponema sp.]
MANSPFSGLLLLKKSPGVTSFESLGMIKKALGTGKVGHTGTLDKFASGLLLVLVGKALKLTPLFNSLDKEYRGTIRFGVETDTLDPEGKIIAKGKIPSREELESVLPAFTGEIMQAPPAFSALHINGQRAYELARAGKGPEMKKRPVTVYALEIISWKAPSAEIRVCCSTGTYIRSLARDLALAAGSRAHLTALERTRIGAFRLDEAFDPNEGKAPAFAIRPVDEALFKALKIKRVLWDGEKAAAIMHGKSLDGFADTLPGEPTLAIFGSAGTGPSKLLAVIEQNMGKWSYSHVFANN